MKSNPRSPLSLYGASHGGGGIADHHEEVAMPAGSAMTSASARQARCINRAAEAWLHSARPQKKPRREAGLSCCSLTCRKGLAAWRSPVPEESTAMGPHSAPEQRYAS